MAKPSTHKEKEREREREETNSSTTRSTTGSRKTARVATANWSRAEQLSARVDGVVDVALRDQRGSIFL